MRPLFVLAILAGLAAAHGESGRTPPNTGGGGFTVPHGGVTTGKDSGPRGGPTTVRPVEGRHTWDVWWAYNRESLFAERLRGRPVSGLRPLDNEPAVRRRLREGRLLDVMLAALEDKNNLVRSSAAIALGKFGLRAAAHALERHSHFPPENRFDVRESAVYAIGLLALPENRKLLAAIAGDKERGNKERSLAMVGWALDGTEESADLLVWHLRYFRSGFKAEPEAVPLEAEQERRRFAAHLLGFVRIESGDYDELLHTVALGSRKWGPGEQGLAVTALGNRRARDYREDMFRWLYRRGLDRQVRRSAAIALGGLLRADEAAGIRRLGRFVRDSKRDDIAQHFAVMSLGRIGGAAAVEVLAGLLRDRVFASDADRAFVHVALGLAGRRTAAARELLEAAYRRARTWEARSALAVACGLARVRAAVPLTIALLDKASLGSGAGAAGGGFLAWAALGLGLHGDARGIPIVRGLFDKYADACVREQAAIAQVLLERRAAVGGLIRILKEAGTMHAKAAVVTALGLLPDPDPEAVDALIDAYRTDANPDSVRAMAIIALGALVDPRPIPLSAEMARNYNYFIRSLALDEIASLL